MSDVIASIARSLEVGDVDLDQLLAPGAVLWHNDDGVDMDARAGFARTEGLRALVEGLQVVIVRDEPFPGGVVAQVELRGTVRSTGQPLLARNCIILTLAADGRLQRLDEYVDPTFLSQLGVA